MQHKAHLQQLSGDPTNTQGIRNRFLKAIRKRFKQLRGQIRDAVSYGNDILHLARDARLVDAEDVEKFPTRQGKTRKFIEWLAERLSEGVLEFLQRDKVRNGEHYTATYIRAAYVKGWENATQRLQNEGVSVDTAEDVFNLGVPQRQVKKLFIRAFTNLESVTKETAPAVRDTLTEGLVEGINPRQMADRLTKEVQDIQRTQAEVLARTETINSYSEATLDRFDRAGVGEATVSGEFSTADDERVCPICESIEGREFSTDAMREMTFQFEPTESEPDSLAGTYPVKPPVHPNCRCAILPVVS